MLKRIAPTSVTRSDTTMLTSLPTRTSWAIAPSSEPTITRAPRRAANTSILMCAADVTPKRRDKARAVLRASRIPNSRMTDSLIAGRCIEQIEQLAKVVVAEALEVAMRVLHRARRGLRDLRDRGDHLIARESEPLLADRLGALDRRARRQQVATQLRQARGQPLAERARASIVVGQAPAMIGLGERGLIRQVVEDVFGTSLLVLHGHPHDW